MELLLSQNQKDMIRNLMPIEELENTESIIKTMKLECNAYKVTDQQILKQANQGEFDKKKFSSLFDTKLQPDQVQQLRIKILRQSCADTKAIEMQSLHMNSTGNIEYVKQPLFLRKNTN